MLFSASFRVFVDVEQVLRSPLYVLCCRPTPVTPPCPGEWKGSVPSGSHAVHPVCRVCTRRRQDWLFPSPALALNRRRCQSHPSGSSPSPVTSIGVVAAVANHRDDRRHRPSPHQQTLYHLAKNTSSTAVVAICKKFALNHTILPLGTLSTAVPVRINNTSLFKCNAIQHTTELTQRGHTCVLPMDRLYVYCIRIQTHSSVVLSATQISCRDPPGTRHFWRETQLTAE